MNNIYIYNLKYNLNYNKIKLLSNKRMELSSNKKINNFFIKLNNYQNNNINNIENYKKSISSGLFQNYKNNNGIITPLNKEKKKNLKDKLNYYFELMDKLKIINQQFLYNNPEYKYKYFYLSRGITTESNNKTILNELLPSSFSYNSTVSNNFIYPTGILKTLKISTNYPYLLIILSEDILNEYEVLLPPHDINYTEMNNIYSLNSVRIKKFISNNILSENDSIIELNKIKL